MQYQLPLIGLRLGKENLDISFMWGKQFASFTVFNEEVTIPTAPPANLHESLTLGFKIWTGGK